MTTFFSGLLEGGAAPGLVKTMAFQQARVRTIAENVANYDTPSYRAKQLDNVAFQRSLRDAFEARKQSPERHFDVNVRGQVKTDDHGQLVTTPTEVPPDNLLFHDGTNMSIEREMADLADAGMRHEQAAELLSGYFDGMRKAIRGRL